MKTPLKFAAVLAVAALFAGGCATNSVDAGADGKNHSEMLLLREGDVVKIAFPGSPNLDTTQQIRRDGKVVLPLVGEVPAAGKTPEDLQKKLADLFEPQIASRQVTVSLQTSAFPVFVNGAVVHPGKIMSDHPITALEAVMEAGGFDAVTANTKAVKIIRNEAGTMKNYKLNLQDVLDGRSDKPFYLKPGDIVFVPERFQMF